MNPGAPRSLRDGRLVRRAGTDIATSTWSARAGIGVQAHRTPRAVGFWIALLVVFALSPALEAQTGDGPVFALIDATKPIAEAVTVDGLEADWSGIPAFPDPPGDARGDGSRDIRSVAIAPLSDAWLVRIETRAPPSIEDLAFWLDIDYRGAEALDLELGLYDGFPDILWRYPEGGSASMSSWDESTTVLGNIVEVRIPLAALDTELRSNNPEMADDLTGSGARSWIRVTPVTRDSGLLVDTGPAVASYRLLETPFTLDPPLPTPTGSPDPAVPLRKPLAGIQYVGQGADGIYSHGGIWGYDLFKVDHSLHPDDPSPSGSNDDYFSFGEPVLASTAGTLASFDDVHPDLPPRPNPCAWQPPNFAFLDAGGGAGVLFSHLVQGSVSATVGTAFDPGETIGSLGHSGSCSWPHLHLEARTIGGGDPSRPIELIDLEVGLNRSLKDPWSRRLSTWGVREGFFIRSHTCSDPTLALDQNDIGSADHFLGVDSITADNGFLVRSIDTVELSSPTILLGNGFSVAAGAELLINNDTPSCL